MDNKGDYVTVCLKNVPNHLKVHGLRNLFKDIGSVGFIKLHRTATNLYAFINFDNLKCAELAIKKINESNFLNMTAEFGKYKKIGGIRQTKISENDHNKIIENLNRGFNLNNHAGFLFTKPIAIEEHCESVNSLNPIKDKEIDSKIIVENLNNGFKMDDAKHQLVNNVENRNIKEKNLPEVKHEANKYNKSKKISNAAFRNNINWGKATSSKIIDIGHCDKGKQHYEYKTSDTLNENEIIIGNCNRCNKTADKRCERCFDYYCSVECQKQDWHKHRFVCIELPKLIDCPKKTETKMVTNEISPVKMTDKTVMQEKELKINEPKKCYENVEIVSNDTKNVKTMKSISTILNETPKKINVEVNAKDFIPFAMFPPKNSIVKITSFESVNEVYIRSIEKAANDEFSLLLQDIFDYASIAQPFTTLPNVGDLVLATQSNDSKYRAVIEQVLENGFFVCFIDYGNRTIIPLKDLAPLSIELKLRKRYTFKVILKDVDKKELLNEKAIDYIRNAINNNIQFKLFHDDNNKRIVELLAVSSHEDFNKKLKQLMTINVPVLNDSPIFNNVKKLPLPIGENCTKLLILDNSQLIDNTISCIHSNNITKLIFLKHQLTEYCLKTKDIYLPRPNELCLVQIDDSWYRGCCIESSGDQHPSIFLIDYGVVNKINTESIRKIPKGFAEIPCMTHSCVIADLPEYKNDILLEKLKDIFKCNTQITIDNIECIDVISSDCDESDEKTFILHIPNILKQLI